MDNKSGKYVLELINGDNRTVLEICDTKEQALEKGAQYRTKYSKDCGLIGCILASVDNDGTINRERYKIIECW